MAITFPTVFQSAISTDPAATAAGYLTPTRYNQGCSVAGLGTNQLLYSTAATVLAQSANLTYSDTGSPGSGPMLTVGSGATTSCGFAFGEISSNLAGIWLTGSGTPTTTNYLLTGNDPGGGGATTFAINNGNGGSFTQLVFRIGGVQKTGLQVSATDCYFDGAGAGTILHFRTDGNNDKLTLYGAGRVVINGGTAIPAGGTAGLGYGMFSTTNFGVFGGSGAPSLAAAKGSIYLRSDGTGIADRMYVNTDGNVTWTNFVTAA